MPAIAYLADMVLSVIIVNYNVRHFLEQCLRSVERALAGMEAEIIVVDNHSTDDSVAYLQPLFPSVRFMTSSKNRGFAQANNRGLSVARGEYVVFLNPDTLVPENCFKNCIAFFEQQPRAGALGVQMIDGRGRFLPESKRSFPSPMASMFKLSGLAKVFPESRLFSQYALGYLDKNENHRVDVLAGAFILMKRSLALELNGFDEDYFLYGEDIDLSYRIRKAGYENHYFSGVTIIHFKGESSHDHEWVRVKFFYRAMQTFVHKHYTHFGGKLFSAFLSVAIVLRKWAAYTSRLLGPALLPLSDILIAWLCLWFVKSGWELVVRHGRHFGVPFVKTALPLFALLFTVAAALGGLYDKRYQPSKAATATVFGALVMLAIYSLLPETVRFSRGVILGGGLLSIVCILFFRQRLLNAGSRLVNPDTPLLTAVVGDEEDFAEVVSIYDNAMLVSQIVARIPPGAGIASIAREPDIRRIVFCAGSMSLENIISEIKETSATRLRFLFHMKNTLSVAGSHTLAPGAEIVSPFITYRIADPYQQRIKRLLDLLLALLLLPASLFHPQKKGLLANIGKVLAGKRTWVGYAGDRPSLPRIRKGILTPPGNTGSTADVIPGAADRFYARNYDWWQDMGIVFRNYRRLGDDRHS